MSCYLLQKLPQIADDVDSNLTQYNLLIYYCHLSLSTIPLPLSLLISGSHTPIGVSQSPSKIPSLSRIPTPSKSRIPVKPSSAAATVGVSKSKTGSEYQDNDEVLYISEEMVTTSDDNMDVVESRSPAPKIQDRRCSQVNKVFDMIFIMFLKFQNGRFTK